jgi:hypothetical protein
MKTESSRQAFQVACCFLLATASALYGCSGQEAIAEGYFVGKWKSSKLTTPLYLYANGEWEIKTKDGAILQFGVWEYKDKKIIWSYKVDSYIGHDVNAVVSATPGEFRLRESDNTTTTFTKLD